MKTRLKPQLFPVDYHLHEGEIYKKEEFKGKVTITFDSIVKF